MIKRNIIRFSQKPVFMSGGYFKIIAPDQNVGFVGLDRTVIDKANPKGK